MKNNLICLFLGIVLGALILRNCSTENEKITITTPKVVNKITDTLIKHSSVKIPVEVPKWYKDTKTEKELKKELAEREMMYKKYQMEYNQVIDDYMNADSLLKIEKFKNAISLKNFESTKEDEFLILNTKGIVAGEVKEIETFYTIKSQKIEVPIKNKNFSLSGGIGADFINNTPVYKVGAGYKNYKIDYLPTQKIGVISYEIKF